MVRYHYPKIHCHDVNKSKLLDSIAEDLNQSRFLDVIEWENLLVYPFEEHLHPLHMYDGASVTDPVLFPDGREDTNIDMCKNYSVGKLLKHFTHEHVKYGRNIALTVSFF